jgi:hypothetical protein
MASPLIKPEVIEDGMTGYVADRHVGVTTADSEQLPS